MRRLLLPAALLLTFALALGIRLYDLTDPPFDFHPTRQWRAALIARGMYYQALPDASEPERTIAVQQWQRERLIEPPIMEWLAARLYLLGGAERLWIARALSAAFWLFGGLAVFQLARGIANTGAALTSLAYFLFLPYGMIASRSFQPDPLMVALTAWALLMLQRWISAATWRRALAAGLFSGLAILVKFVAVFPIGMAALGLVLAGPGLRRALRDRQAWAVAGLALLPVGAYYINGLYISGFLAGQDSFRVFSQLWTDPAFYIRWVEMATGICGFAVLLAGLAGILLARERTTRGMLAGLWTGYAIYSLLFPFHTITHDYYTLPLVPIAAVSLAPAAALLFDEIGRRPYRHAAWAALAVLATAAVLFQVWDARVILARQDFRDEAAEWTRFRELIPPGEKVVAIAQAYGFPLAYYGWVTAQPWLSESDAALRSLSGQTGEDIAARRLAALEEADLFLITNFNELDNQEGLEETLREDYEVYAEGDGYLIFDLQAPAQP